MTTVPTSVPGFDAPNLDALDVDELYAIATVFRKYADYCRFIASAKTWRLRGAIQNANLLEAVAQDYYDQLPDWAKW
jgi:hypothetical protein